MSGISVRGGPAASRAGRDAVRWIGTRGREPLGQAVASPGERRGRSHRCWRRELVIVSSLWGDDYRVLDSASKIAVIQNVLLQRISFRGLAWLIIISAISAKEHGHGTQAWSYDSDLFVRRQACTSGHVFVCLHGPRAQPMPAIGKGYLCLENTGANRLPDLCAGTTRRIVCSRDADRLHARPQL